MKKIKLVLSVLLILLFCSIPVSAVFYNDGVSSYRSYVYDNNNEPMEIPSPFDYYGKITGEDIGIKAFGEIADIFYSYEDKKIYIADRTENRIVVLNEDFSYSGSISGFSFKGKTEGFSHPSGVCVRDGVIYISDTDNSRIVTLNSKNHKALKIFGKPEISLLGDGYVYKPTRLAVGITGQMYVIGKDINSGFIMLESDGKFQSFIGAPEVKTDFLDEIWKLFMTKAQKQGLNKSVPTEYNSVVFDSKGFLYATTQSEGVQPVVRLNLQGQEILTYDEEYPQGDGLYETNKSAFVDVCVNNSGAYFVLDSVMGRIFAYNKSGQMLFAFGGKGIKDGLNYSPSGIELIDDKLLVTDSVTHTINVYKMTEFGKMVIEGDSLMHSGEYEAAYEKWSSVLKQCPAYTIASNSLGKLALYEKNYSKAMSYFKISADKEGFSEAFRSYRTDTLYEKYPIIIFVLIVGFGLIIIYKKIISKTSVILRLKNNRIGSALGYANYCMFHPFDGFWCLKREKRGNLATANIIVIIFLIIFAVNTQFSGYLFIDSQPEDVKVIVSVLSVIIVMACYCLGNWCFTSLMDGKGTLKEIYISMAFALKPYLYGGIILFGLSHFLSLQEAFIYNTVSAGIFIWVFGLLFFGMMMTHDYSLGTGVKTLVLTVIGMALIIFIGLILTNLIDDIIQYFYGIYREILYRNL